MRQHASLRLAGLLFSVAVVWAETPGWQAGAKAPLLFVEEAGRRIPLEEFVRETPAAILVLPRSWTDIFCEPLTKAAAAVAAERVRVTVVAEAGKGCASISGVARAVPVGFVVEKTEELRLILVDPSAIVRLVEPAPLSPQGLERLGSLAANWEGGRQLFITQCGHCHGEDGADTSYAGVKTLAGVSRRMTGELILEGGRQFGAVDMTSWSQKIKDLLLLYIRGL